jgi:hypothetical protein
MPTAFLAITDSHLLLTGSAGQCPPPCEAGRSTLAFGAYRNSRPPRRDRSLGPPEAPANAWPPGPGGRLAQSGDCAMARRAAARHPRNRAHAGPPAFLKRWNCCGYGYRFEAEGRVVAISSMPSPDRASAASRSTPMCSYIAATWRAQESRTSISAGSCSTHRRSATQLERSLRARMRRHSCSPITVREARRRGRPRPLRTHRHR